MNATAAIAAALLRGEILSIKTAFRKFGVTNLPREIGRSIERKFGVEVAKVQKEGLSRYKVPCIWYEYRLPTTDYNKDGREKMEKYVEHNFTDCKPELNTIIQSSLFQNDFRTRETDREVHR